MTAVEILYLDDDTLARLYSDFSEETMCAGWDPSLAQDFVDAMLSREASPRVLSDYEIATLAEIRQILRNRLQAL